MKKRKLCVTAALSLLLSGITSLPLHAQSHEKGSISGKIHELNEKENVTVLLITHYMDEVIGADKVIVMDGGKVVMQGTPREIFSQVEKMKSYRLDVPQVTELAWELKKAGMPMPDGILTVEEFTEAWNS